MSAAVESKLILCLPLGLSLGGVVTWCSNFAVACQAAGGNVLLAAHDGTVPGELPPPEGIEVMRLPGPCANVALRWHISDIAETLKTHGPGVIFPNGGHAGYAAGARLKEQRNDFQIIGIAHADESSYYECLSYYEPVIDRFIGVSGAIQEKLTKVLPPERACDVICEPYGIPIPALPGRSYSAADEPLQLLYAGRLIEQQKRVSRLAALVQHLPRDVSFTLHIAGDGPERATLEAACASRGGMVQFHGTLDPVRMSALFGRCDALILVSDFEGTSLAMLEAMAHGLIPLVSNVSGIRGVVCDGANGFIHEIGDTPQLVRQIETLARDRAMLATIGEAARDTVRQERSISANVENVRRLAADARARPHEFRGLGRPVIPRQKEMELLRVRGWGWLKTRLGRP